MTISNNLITEAMNNENSKKREDLTSLGSDDSGIICGSEPDQQSLTRIRRSRESLSSGENEQSEEECIELLETTSMDEEYRMLQSDLCFFQQSTEEEKSSSKDKSAKVASSDKPEDQETPTNQPLEEAINDHKVRYREMNMNQASILKEKYQTKVCVPIEFEEEETTPTAEQPEPKEAAAKNEVIKSFFGVTKNAIFRTAQSIIENHEKKSSKNKEGKESSGSEASTPQPPKKREFLRSHKKAMATLTSSASAEIPTISDKEKEKDKRLSKSSSTSSLLHLKAPGMAQSLVKVALAPQIKAERGHSGLLRLVFLWQIENIIAELEYFLVDFSSLPSSTFTLRCITCSTRKSLAYSAS